MPGGTCESYFGTYSALYSPGSEYVLEAFTSIGTASVTLLAPGRPVYTGSNNYTWSPEGNADFAESYSQTAIYFQSENTTADIDSPYTFPTSAFANPISNYTSRVVSRSISFDIFNANPQSFFIIGSYSGFEPAE
jgi:hypothetical protein